MSVMCPKQDQSVLPLNPFDNPYKITGFLQQSWWLHIISDHSTQELLSLIAIPAFSDPLSSIVQVIKFMFK